MLPTGRTRRRRSIASAFTLAAGVLATPAAHAQQYTITPFGVPGALRSEIEGINAFGHLVGSYSTHANPYGREIGFLYDGRSFRDIVVPGASWTIPRGINAAGHITGSYGDAAGTHGFVYMDGSFTRIDVPFGGPYGVFTFAYGINNLGQVVGSYYSFGPRISGFLYDAGVFTPLRVPGADETIPWEINDAGQIVGNHFPFSPFYVHSFLYSGGTYATTELGVAYTAINNAGQIVGRGMPTGLPGRPTGINDAGQIVGIYEDGTGVGSFIATPTVVPEPGALALVAGGVGLLGSIAVRRGTRGA